MRKGGRYIVEDGKTPRLVERTDWPGPAGEPGAPPAPAAKTPRGDAAVTDRPAPAPAASPRATKSKEGR